MDALTRPFDPERPAHGPLVPFRLAILVPFGGAGLLAVAAGHAGVLSLEVMRVVGVGGFLGGHLLLSASRTLGYPIRVGPPAWYLSALLYDVGANVLSAECFFRGTLFNRWQRRWGFWPGALAATGLSILRYLVDPALPRVAELMVGAVFYLALLSLSGCALLWYSGSLLPSLAASLAFFGAYRTLAVR